MALDSTLEKIIEYCGHDGSQDVDGCLDEPYNRQGFNLAEMIRATTLLGKTVTPLLKEVHIDYGHPAGYNISMRATLKDADNWRLAMLHYNRAVIIVPTEYGYEHAVAYNPDNRQIYNPNGLIYTMTKEYQAEDVFMIK